MDNNFIIGFSNKFFTLWKITEIKGNDSNNVCYYHEYIKNISFSEDKVKEVYPNIVIDKTINGKHSFYSYTKDKNKIDDDKFQFGRFVSELINECKDNEYLKWYFNNCYNEKSKAVAADVLISRGWKLDDNDIISPKEIKNMNDEHEYFKSLISSKKIEVEINTNPSEEGIVKIKDNIFIKFPEVKEMYYNGYFYYMPIVNRKTKRVKNKTIKITEFEYMEKPYMEIKIKKFEILKK